LKEDFRVKFINFMLLLLLALVPGTVGTILAAARGVEWQVLVLPAVVTLAVGVTLSVFMLLNLYINWMQPLQRVLGFLNLLGEGDPVRAEQSLAGASLSNGLKGPVTAVLDSFYRMIGSMQRTADQLTHFSQELQAATGTSQQSLGEVTTAMQEIAGGADEQAGAAQRVAENMNNLQGLAEEIVKRANLGAAAVAEVKSKEEEGRRLLEQLLQEIQAEANSNQEAAGRMRQLENKMQEINTLVQAVTAIADQTNLLSLNAAIEAARAGEQGRGFAVVAEEVRKLAEQSAKAAQNITSLAAAISAEARQTAAQVDKNVELVQNNLQRGAQVEQNFADIGQAIKKTTEAMADISSHAQGQLGKVREASEAASRMAAVAEETAASIEEVSAASQEQKKVMTAVDENTRQYTKIAQEFFTMAADFTRHGWDENLRRQVIDEGFAILEKLATNPAVKSMNANAMKPVIDAAFNESKIIKTFIVAGKDGVAVYAIPASRITNWAFRPWFQRAIKGERYASDPYVTQSTNRVAVSISLPIYNAEGQIIGVLEANIAPAEN